MPVPTLGPVAFDAAKGVASIPVSYPAGSEGLTLVLNVQYPGQDSYQSFTPEAQPGKSNIISIPLGADGKSPPSGQYTFKAILKDPKTQAISETSPVVKLNI